MVFHFVGGFGRWRQEQTFSIVWENGGRKKEEAGKQVEGEEQGKAMVRKRHGSCAKSSMKTSSMVKTEQKGKKARQGRGRRQEGWKTMVEGEKANEEEKGK